MRTNDAVLISYVEALFKEARIGHFVADRNMSIVEGSLGILPRRIMVEAEDEARARRLLSEAGFDKELTP